MLFSESPVLIPVNAFKVLDLLAEQPEKIIGAIKKLTNNRITFFFHLLFPHHNLFFINSL